MSSREPSIEVNDHYLATHDHMTGLLNRRGLDEQLGTLMEEHPGQFAVLIVDLDDLKKTNDRHGHESGDDLLKHTALALQVATRHHDQEPDKGHDLRSQETNSDVLSVSRRPQEARMGGDEFVLLFPGVDTEEKLAIVEGRVRHSLKVEGVRASIGGVLHQGPMDTKMVLSLADFAMILDKEERKLARYSPEKLKALQYIGALAAEHEIDAADISPVLAALERRSQD